MRILISVMASAVLLAGCGSGGIPAAPPPPPPSTAPVANGDSYSLNQDTTLTVAAPGVVANDTDPNNLALTAAVFGPPAHGTLTLNANGSFTYVPMVGYVGTDSFTYKASNGTTTSGSATVSLTVNEVVPTPPPTVVGDTYTVNQNTTLSVAAPGVLANDTDPSGLSFTAAVLAAPAHGTLTLAANGSFTYVPATGYFGADSFTYRASNAAATSTAATVNLTVNQVAPTAPTAVGDLYTVNQNTTLTIAAPGVLANDTEPNNLPLTAALVTSVAHGTVALNPNGSFSYTPTTAYFGADSFTYTVSNGTTTSAAATVSLTVNQRPPVAVANNYSVNQNAVLTVAAPGVLANDTDPSNLALTAAVVSGPSHGTLALNANGGFTYTPTAAYFGADSYTYRANNGTLNSTAATVSLTVTQLPPVATADSYSIAQNATLTVAAPGVLSNDTDPSGLSLTASQVTGPAHGTLSLNANGGFVYTPTASYTGADSFTYRAGNGTLTSSPATVSITVTAGSSFGIDTRPTLAPLSFPTSTALPTDITLINAFPNLSSGFQSPLFFATAPGDTTRAFVVEQRGVIRVLSNNSSVTSSSVFLDISARVTGAGGELGLLGLAFDPDYVNNGYFYVNYNPASGQRRTVISRFHVTANPNVADSNSETQLLTYDQPFDNHNGGWLGFGPDGKLYIGSGDGGSGGDPLGNGQNLNVLLGKMLRINKDGTIPSDNPFVGQANTRGEIWAYGMRNPFRASFDRGTGNLWVGDVGQDAYEEIDVITRGGNYGWNTREGFHGYPNASTPPPPGNNFLDPVAEYSHSTGGCSVTGGYVYRGAVIPALSGTYIYADFCSGNLWSAAPGTPVTAPATVTPIGQVSSSPSSFGEDGAGELYVTSLFEGRVYKLMPSSGTGGGTFPQKLSQTGLFTNTANLVPNPGLIEYEVNDTFWSDGTRKRRWVAIPNNTQITFSPTGAWVFPQGSVTVKYFEITLNTGVVKRLETRVFVNQSSGWQGYTYKWNAAGTDADLLTDAQTETFTAQGSTTPQLYEYPSRAACLGCHTAASGRVLGVRTVQLNRTHLYPSTVTDNQLRTLNHIGWFTSDIGAATNYEVLTDPLNTAASLSLRARAYLDTNCSQCHQPGGPTPVNMDLRYTTAITSTNTLNVTPSAGDLGLSNARRIAPGSKESSVLWERMRRLDQYRMPNLGSHVADPDGVTLIGQWIDAGAN